MAPKYDVLPPLERRALFKKILTRCEEQGSARPPVVVFDLDGTLMDNRPRTIAILHELGKKWRDSRAEHSSKLLAADVSKMAYLVKETLLHLGITDPAIAEEAENFWKERFFSDDALTHDVALPGAVEFARACYARGAVLVYFTGRDLPLMGVGSFRSLRDLGFPIGVVGTELVLKPEFSIPDETFKRGEVNKLERLGDVVAAFDNEPANCNIFAEHHPDAESVFVDTQHLPGAPDLFPSVKVVRDFAVD